MLDSHILHQTYSLLEYFQCICSIIMLSWRLWWVWWVWGWPRQVEDRLPYLWWYKGWDLNWHML